MQNDQTTTAKPQEAVKEPRIKIVQGVRVQENHTPIDFTLAFRSQWIDLDKRCNPDRFSGKRVNQDSRKLANLLRRHRRLKKIGWNIRMFAS